MLSIDRVNNAAAKMTIIGLLLGALTAPFYIQFFVGQSLDVQLMDIIWHDDVHDLTSDEGYQVSARAKL